MVHWLLGWLVGYFQKWTLLGRVEAALCGLEYSLVQHLTETSPELKSRTGSTQMSLGRWKLSIVSASLRSHAQGDCLTVENLDGGRGKT